MKLVDRKYAEASHAAEKGDRVEFNMGSTRFEIFYDDNDDNALRIRKTSDRMTEILIAPCVSNEVKIS